MDEKECIDYEAQRKKALRKLESLGLEVIPLEVAAAVLPTLPEWEQYQVSRKWRRSWKKS